MVKILNREIGNRMWGGKSNVYGVSGGGTGGGDVDLSSYATMAWTKQNFVSIDYFRTLFKAFDSNDDEIVPNNTTSVVDNIKVMVGLWTEQYLTALGNQSGGGGGGGGAQYLNDLLDVQLTTPLTDGQALVYNATLQKWVNGAAGVNMTTVWNAMAGSTNEQINASHLSTALSGYVTTSAISDMATQTWVGQQGFATQTWVTSNFITIAYFDRLFRAYNGNTLVSHNDTTSTIDNIKAMFGFWTDFYLSALGTGGVSSVSISLSQLADVNVAGVTNGQVLSYNSTNAEWVPTTISNVTSLSALTDVALSSPTTYQVLMYDASTTKWYNSALKTINGQPLYGSGDISVGGGASGNYLPLSGGTLTGRLDVNISSGLYAIYTNGFIRGKGIESTANFRDVQPSGTWYLGYEAVTSNGCFNIAHSIYGLLLEIGYEIIQFDRRILVLNGGNTSSHIGCGINGDTETVYLSYYQGRSAQLHLQGLDNMLWLSSNGYIGIGTSSPSYLLDVNGDLKGKRIWMTDNLRDIQPSGTWYLGYEAVTSNGCFNIAHSSVGVIISISTSGLTSQGYITALSDIRHKTVIKDAAVSVEDIARMPAVMYQWNDGREDKELHVGSIAQNWQAVLPEVVLKANDKEGTLSMQYGVAALVSSIIIARKVVSHEKRIKQLEKENKELKERLKIA